MLERYTRPEMGNIWTEENKYRAWLEVEILADEAWAELGEIPQEDVKKIREHASFDIDRILEIEKLHAMMSLRLHERFLKHWEKKENGSIMV